MQKILAFVISLVISTGTFALAKIRAQTFEDPHGNMAPAPGWHSKFVKRSILFLKQDSSSTIHKKHNYVWDNKAYSLIDKTFPNNVQ